MKFLKWFLLSLCVIVVILVAILGANNLKEKRIMALQDGIYTYLSGLGQLETMKIDYQKDVDLGAKVIPNIVNPQVVNQINSKYIYSFSGYVSAGVDLGKLVSTGIVLGEGLIIEISLPSAEILKISLVYTPKEANGSLIMADESRLGEATQIAMKAMGDAAKSENIIDISKVNAEKIIKEDLLKKYDSVKDVIFK